MLSSIIIPLISRKAKVIITTKTYCACQWKCDGYLILPKPDDALWRIASGYSLELSTMSWKIFLKNETIHGWGRECKIIGVTRELRPWL